MTIQNSGSKAILIAALMGLSACASPIPATFDSGDITAFGTTLTSFSSATDSTGITRAGSATYAGLFNADMGSDGNFIGDVSLTANFDDESISGDVTNINLLGNPDLDDQTLDGSVDVTGTIDKAAGTLAATGAGSLTAVATADGFGLNVDVDVTTTVAGAFKTATSAADTIVGTVEISGTITPPAVSGEDPITIDPTTADFYAQEQ